MTSITGSPSVMGQMRMQRPDPAQMASKLFAKLDTQNKGYIEKSDLQSAFDQISGSSSATGVDDVFQQFDSDSDGKITKDEMSSGFAKLAEQLDSHYHNMRMNGMPPPPPQGGDDAGFTKGERANQPSEIGSAGGGSASITADASSSEAAVMKKIMQLMHAYGGMAQDRSQSPLPTQLSVSA